MGCGDEAERLLDVSDLRVTFQLSGGRSIRALTGLTFSIHGGETIGFLGESGCGKTTAALALIRLLPHTALELSGTILFRGRDLVRCGESDLEKIRGSGIALIFQEPSAVLNPVMCVGQQVAEVVHARARAAWNLCRHEAAELLERVGLRNGDGIYEAYPHQLSGGQKQRVMIAQALGCRPALLIADEPATGLDAGSQAEILDLFRTLKRGSRTAFLFISHHPEFLAGLADRINVMYAGQIVEEGSAHQVYGSPLHPYTQGLLHSMPEAFEEILAAPGKRLQSISGSAPEMTTQIRGCSFAPRCHARMEICGNREPSMIEASPGHRARCFLYDQ